MRYLFIGILMGWGPINTGSAQSVQRYNRFDEVLGHIKEQHVSNVNIDSIVDLMVRDYLNDTSTIRQLLQHLDPYSAFYDSLMYGDLRTNLSGSFGGLGLVVSIIDDVAYIAQVFPDAPAIRSGLRPGDEIMQIDDVLVSRSGIDYWTIIQSLRGQVGSTVMLRVKHPSGDQEQFTIVREKIQIKSVPAASMLNGTTGYIKVTAFTDSTSAEVQAAILHLKKNGMRKLIIDLRDNPGGYMMQATRMADEFLAEGALMVYTVGRTGRKDVLATAGGAFEHGEVAILVNANTASSAEIFTAALQGNERAKVYGTRTFGKGLVQRIFPISDSTEAVKLTTDLYYTPKGVCIQQPYQASTYTYRRDQEQVTDLHSGHISAINEAVPEWGIVPDVWILEDTGGVVDIHTQLLEREYIQHAALLYFRAELQDLSTSYYSAEHFAQQYVLPDDVLVYFEEHISRWELTPSQDFTPLQFTHQGLVAEADQIRHTFRSSLAQMLYGDIGYYLVEVANDSGVIRALQDLE